jgi:hypothetical protein
MALQRRILLSRWGAACAAAGLALALGPARAQRATNPIARPPRQRLAGAAIAAGRFNSGGVSGGALPGLYTVVAVDKMGNLLQLRDEAGTTAPVAVANEVFDIDTLKPGDQVEVDFKAPPAGSTRLEAAGVWPVEK